MPSMLRQKVQCVRRPFEILHGHPMPVSGTLLGFYIVLNINESVGSSGALYALSKAVRLAGDACKQCIASAAMKN